MRPNFPSFVSIPCLLKCLPYFVEFVLVALVAHTPQVKCRRYMELQALRELDTGIFNGYSYKQVRLIVTAISFHAGLPNAIVSRTRSLYFKLSACQSETK